MTTTPTDRRNMLRGALTGVAIIVVWYAVTWAIRPIAREMDVIARLELAMSWICLLAAPMIIAIVLVAFHRFSTNRAQGGWDPFDGLLEVYRGNLTNTTEQVLVAIPVHTAFALSVPAGWLWLLPSTVMLFLLGRVMFLRGYLGPVPTNRIAGYVCTFLPSILLFLLTLGVSIFGPLMEVQWRF